MRVSCSHGCGVYLTSLVSSHNPLLISSNYVVIVFKQNGGHVSVNCGDIANDMAIIKDSCSSPAGFVHGSITFGGSHWVGLGGTRC